MHMMTRTITTMTMGMIILKGMIIIMIIMSMNMTMGMVIMKNCPKKRLL